MKHTQNEEAVSPVIGVILMVAITVILAAVIAAFVFGMGGNIQHARIVAVTVHQPTTDQIVVTYMGGQDSSSFTGANVSINENLNATKEGILGSTVGSSVRYYPESGKDFSGVDHVIVTGHFTDGSAQVLVDTYV